MQDNKENEGEFQRKKKVEQAKYPGERLQIDIKYVPEECIQFGTHDQKYYQITALDEYTRKRVLRTADEKSTYQTSKFLENLEKELGFSRKFRQTMERSSQIQKARRKRCLS